MSGKMKIGYVGVGLMGLPMAKRLLSLGYAVRAYDIAPAQVAAARDAGATSASSAADAVRNADLVLINLPTPEAVEAAVFGENGVAAALRPPQLLIDFSTIKVHQCKAYALRLREATEPTTPSSLKGLRISRMMPATSGGPKTPAPRTRPVPESMFT